MPISSLPNECFSDVLSYLDKKTLYKCLFVNRYFCKITIPLIWREPFRFHKNISLINTLLACLNEDEISSLIPCAINFNNNQTPLFEYGKFIKKLSHASCLSHILNLLGLFSYNRVQDCRIQKLVNVIYHMIMRQDSNLQEFSISNMWENIYLPTCSTFTAYEPGITNLKSLKISLDIVGDGAIEFLNMISKFCNGIVDCRLYVEFFKSIVDIIKSQPLKRLTLCSGLSFPFHIQGEDKEVIYALKFRSETLKELTFSNLDFRDIDLSFMSKLDRLERLKLINCKRYLFTKKLHLKELSLCYDHSDEEYDYNTLKITRAMINPLLSEELHMLNFSDIVTPEVVKVVRESCPNLKFLQINIGLDKFSSLTILLICELSSLKILKIILQNHEDVEVLSRLVAENLGNNLEFVEYLLLDFPITLPSFEYFTNNCKADLKQLIIYINPYEHSRKDHLIHVSNYQKVHNSLKLLGTVGYYSSARITKEESEIIDLLKNQGVGVEFYDQFNLTFEEDIKFCERILKDT